MNEEQKERVRKLVKALRSGDYKQGEKSLRNGDTFCCLGVACDLYDSDEWIETSGLFSFLKTEIQCYPPKSVFDYYGFESGDPFISDETKRIVGVAVEGNSLSSLNDEGVSFDKIADLIEEEYV